MAERFYFYIDNNKVKKRIAAFTWYPGFAPTQKQKCIEAMHDEIRNQGKRPLEVSTKSKDELGKKLSAFNLTIGSHPLECIFQSSKVFEKGGPYSDLLDMLPKNAKRDERLKSSGKIVFFQYLDEKWPLEPKTLFYDWLYCNAVRIALSEKELLKLSEFDAFTDIEFNANKSINTQARSAALATLLIRQYGTIPIFDKEHFLAFHTENVKG